MAYNPVERNPVTRFLVGFAVIVAMFVGGGAVGALSTQLDVPYAGPVGVLLGALVAFGAFVLVYIRYDRSFDDE